VTASHRPPVGNPAASGRPAAVSTSPLVTVDVGLLPHAITRKGTPMKTSFSVAAARGGCGFSNLRERRESIRREGHERTARQLDGGQCGGGRSGWDVHNSGRAAEWRHPVQTFRSPTRIDVKFVHRSATITSLADPVDTGHRPTPGRVTDLRCCDHRSARGALHAQVPALGYTTRAIADDINSVRGCGRDHDDGCSNRQAPGTAPGVARSTQTAKGLQRSQIRDCGAGIIARRRTLGPVVGKPP